ncbi:protein UL92 [Common bottlenose dolphin gammaherpesvirus 1 strain Sarasota]|uniref:Protein UL92 n=1 Tax=Common bottlenose dolphin gammaherpesvirus 1 strain Sarasota TaxID=2022783 RepID=A0A1Z1NEH4_9GAMA|nr:protein UL92 [Common bottlenose dolphin gammaherpesvirus 1 strain Sarasota]ARW78094.1 protein UL92 [Common bottlenose dolphin gammaherpesvirus 1 strain Sarasota]
MYQGSEAGQHSPRPAFREDGPGCAPSPVDEAPSHQCDFSKVDTPICRRHRITCIYVCRQCHAYHVCDGGRECVAINTGENVVCLLTGRCIEDNTLDIGSLASGTLKRIEQPYEKHVYENIIQSLKVDLRNFFSAGQSMKEVKMAIFDQASSSLLPEIESLIADTFPMCASLFGEISWAYDVVCSMYIHIIISIYSTRTVYGNLLFKCTKNKRYDIILKRMRERWMSMLTTTSC